MSLKNKCLEQQNLWYILYRQFYNVSSTMCIHFLLNSQSFIQQRSYFLSLRIHFHCSFYEEFFCISVFETDFSFFGSLFLPLYSLFFSVFLFLIVLFPVSEKLLFLSLSLSLSSLSLCIRITMNVYSYCLKNPLTKHYSYIFLC